MQYLNPLLVFLGSLWCLTGVLFTGVSPRDWRQKAKAVLGLVGISSAGLSLYGVLHKEIQYSACAGIFYLSKGLLTGVLIGVLISLWLADSLSVVFKIGLLKHHSRAEAPGDAAGGAGSQ